MTRSEEATSYIRTHCQHMGSYAGDFAPYRFPLMLAILFPAAS